MTDPRFVTRLQRPTMPTRLELTTMSDEPEARLESTPRVRPLALFSLVVFLVVVGCAGLAFLPVVVASLLFAAAVLVLGVLVAYLL